MSLTEWYRGHHVGQIAEALFHLMVIREQVVGDDGPIEISIDYA